MRELTPKEKELLKQIVSLKKEGKLSYLQAGKFLKRELSCFALKWQTKPNVQITIYVKPDQDVSKDEVPKSYFDISDFVYFIKELHLNNFIELQTLQSKKKEEECDDDSMMLYDRDIYDYNKDTDEFWTKEKETEFMGKKCTMKGLAYIKNKSIVYLDIVQNLNKYANAIIYPLPRLIDYVEHNFKTIEQRRFEKQKCLTWISILVAVVIGILSPWISHRLSNEAYQNTPKVVVDSLQEVKPEILEQPTPVIQFDTLDVKVLAPRIQTDIEITHKNSLCSDCRHIQK